MSGPAVSSISSQANASISLTETVNGDSCLTLPNGTSLSSSQAPATRTIPQISEEDNDNGCDSDGEIGPFMRNCETNAD